MKPNLSAAALLLVSVLVGLAGCQTSGSGQKSTHATVHPQGTVAHIVLFWLKTPGDADAVRKIIETSETFRAIPGVVDLTVGRPIPSTRPVVDSSFDVGLVIMFADEAALQAYETHPTHAAAVKGTLRPLTSKIQVYDVKK